MPMLHATRPTESYHTGRMFTVPGYFQHLRSLLDSMQPRAALPMRSTMALSKQQQLDKILEGHTKASAAAKAAGCTSGWVRTLIRRKQIRYLTAAGYHFVDDRDIPQLAVALTSRSKGKRGSAKRPASSR